jgi:hypothetical protein
MQQQSIVVETPLQSSKFFVCRLLLPEVKWLVISPLRTRDVESLQSWAFLYVTGAPGRLE